MILACSICGRPVSNDIPNNTIVRAGIICPECLADDKHNTTKIVINVGQDAIPTKTSIARQG